MEQALEDKDAAMKNKLADLKSAFSQELEENSIKIEMLRSDIKVDLSDDILYASGQTQPDSGRRGCYPQSGGAAR